MAFHNFYPAKKYRFTVIPIGMIKEMLMKRRENQKDNIIIVTGSRGEGKSTLTGKILFQFEDFDPFESLVYSKEAMFKQVKKKNNYVWGDESIINVAKGNVMSRSNKLLHELFTVSRSNYNIIFLCMPNIEDFDTKILQYCSMWLHVAERGLAVVMLPNNKGIFGKKNWDLIEMKKIYEEFQKQNQKVHHAPYWIFSNFRAYIRFSKLTNQQEAIINEIKDLRKNENLDKEMKENVVTEVKSLENYNRYSAKKLAELVLKGEIRTKEHFESYCKENKLMPEEMYKQGDSIFRKNDVGTTLKGKIRIYEKEDNLIKF